MNAAMNTMATTRIVSAELIRRNDPAENRGSAVLRPSATRARMNVVIGTISSATS